MAIIGVIGGLLGIYKLPCETLFLWETRSFLFLCFLVVSFRLAIGLIFIFLFYFQELYLTSLHFT